MERVKLVSGNSVKKNYKKFYKSRENEYKAKAGDIYRILCRYLNEQLFYWKSSKSCKFGKSFFPEEKKISMFFWFNNVRVCFEKNKLSLSKIVLYYKSFFQILWKSVCYILDTFPSHLKKNYVLY